MKNIIVTTVDSSGVIAKHTLSGNGPTVINATKNANYEFFDNAKGYGPDHIITRRVDNDLKVSFERTGAEDDLIIKDFYTENAANNNSALIGASKEGEPYYYIPDSAEQTDFVTQLQNGAVQGNALGGEEFVQPWWMGGLPVLAALGIASIGSSDDSPPPPTPPVNPPVVTITEDANNDGIISAGELDGTVGVLIEVHEKTQVGDTLIVTNPDGSMDMIVITQDIKDNGLVLEYPAPANGETIEVKAQVVDYLENASETSSDSAVVESPAIVSLSGDSSVNENNGPATYTISLDKASDTDTVVTYEVQNQTTDGNDFTGATTATVTIPAGQLSVVVEVGINDDGVYEGDENYNVVITGVTGSAELGNDDTVNTVIIDKDMMPSISVDDVTVSESLMGEDVVATFTVTLSHPSTETVEVSFNTEDGSAINGADYTGLSGTVTFAPGETTQTIEVPILDDVYDEEDETFNVVLSSPVNATLDHNGIGTITDEEQYPDLVEVSIVDNYDAVNEGDPAIFPIELRDETGNLIVAATEVTVTVEYTGTAINGDDYTTVSTTVTIPAGASSVNLNIETLTDLLDEGLENVVITVTGATGGGFEALGVDADKCVADVDITDIPHSRVEVNDVIVDEDAGYAEFTVTLTGGIPTADVSVDYATGDVTALNGPDYTGITGTLTFAAGTTVFTQTVQVPIIDDVYAEPYETYDMTLSNSVNATISHSGIGTITDEEQLPDLVEVSIVDNYDAVNEGDTATFPIELRDEAGNLVIAATNVTVTVEYTGTAINGDDYTSVSTTVTILAGESSVNLDIETLTDLLDEDLENVVITVTDATGGGFEALGVDADKCVADVDIIDSSYTTIEIDDVTVDEDAGNAVFTVTLTGDAPTADVTVDYATGDVTALDASDYTGVTGTLVFPLGTLTQTITVPILDDNIAEVAETYSVTLSNAVNATILNSGVGTITDECHTDLDSVYVSIVDNVDSVYEGEVATFTVELRDADGNLNAAITDVTVDIHYSGVAIDGTDYIGVTSVTIPANSSSVDFDITTLDDYIAEGSEIVNIELNSVTGGGFEAIAVDPTKATADMNIVDDCCEAESVVVSILDFVTNVVEGGNGVFPIELHDQDGNPVSAITDTTVDIHYSGVGIDGTDFTGISTIVIPAGSQSNYLVLETIDDNFAEGSELVNIELFNVSGGGFEAIAVDPDHNTADMNIVDDCDSVFVSILDFTTDVIEASSGLFPIVLKDADGNAINAVTDITVNIEYSGVAIDGTDFTGIASVVIPAGAQSTNLILQTLDDNIAEGSEIVNIELTSVSGGGFEAIALDPVMYVADMNIVDDCNYPVTVSIFDDVDSIYEGELASFPIYLTNVDGDPQVALTDVTVTIEYTGSATNGDDYTGSFTVVIPAGASSVDLDIASLEDLLAEGDEIVDITISNPVGGGFEVIGVNPMADTANVTIKDSTIQITVEPSAAFEGDDLVHMVTLSNPSMTDETYSFSLTEGTATENVDYSTAVSFSDGVTFDAVTGEITVPAGVTSFTVTYPTIDDSYADDGETTTLTIGGSSATGTINDEYPPDLVEVSIVDNVDSIYEGTVDPDNIGSFPIELRDQNGDLITAATDVTVDVTYSGTADNGDDFTGVIQVTIPAGQSSVNLDLTVIDDLLAEDDEIVDITISNPVGGGFEAIGIDPDANTADMTIISDDYIQITVEPTAAFEGDDLVHMVTLSNPSMTDETYSFSLTEGTATENVDYSTAVSFSDGVTFDAVTGEITVPAGVTSFTVTYPTIDDSYADDGETTTLTIGGSSATGTINDEPIPDPVEVSIVDNVDSINEGAVDPDNIGIFPIELRDQNGDLITAATDVTVDVTYSGTADNGDDFTGVIQVTIPAGQSSVDLDLTVIDDLLAEDDEIVDITISNPVGGGFESIGVDSDANTADMTIINDDYITDISIDSQSVNEEDGTMTFTVTLSGPAAVADVTVDYATADVTAVDGTDYTNTMGTLTFTPGTLTQTITVPIIDDAVWEATETFDITLSNPSTNANILNSGIGTIVDNDLLAVDDSAAAIEAGGINNGSGSQDATGNVLTNDNPDQTDAIVTDIRVGGVEGSGTAGTLGTALVGTYGTLTVNADGTYVYEVNDDDATVQALNDGDSLTESFNYTMTDGTGSDIAVLEIVIKGSNDCAIPTVTSVTVSEEGLTEFDPIPDTTGNNDTTDSAVATGSISFTDVDNFDANDFSIDLAGPTDITVKGETVSWTWDDLTGQLTGQVVIEGESLEVMTVDVGPITTDGSGGFVADYNTTLLHAIDHPSNDDEDQLDVQFEASVSDGTQSASTNFAVTVEDDRPAQSQSNIDIAAATSDSNITIILDTSGSMSTEISGGETRLDFAKAAIVKLLDGYDVAGDVKVQLITFAKEAQAQPQWMTIDELKASLPGITPGGGTNYDAALDVTMTSYDNAGGIFGANNYSYFLTDGEPTFGQGTVNDFDPGLNGTGAKGNVNADNGIQAQEETLWTTFLNANDIKSYAFAFGPDFDESTIELDPIAYDGQIGEQGATDLARIVTDLDELDDILIDTLPDVIDYGLVNGNLFGADEGHVLTFTLDGITYDYDGSDGSMVASSPSSDIYSYDQSTTTVIINTQAQGVMTLDFETGKYTYETQSLVVDYQEDITFTLIDDDGDSVESTQTIFVYSLSAKDDSVITNDTTGILELDQAVLVGNDNTSPNSEVTTTFDVNGGQTSGVDPVIYTTTDFSGVNSFDYTISENDVSSSALVSIEYQQGDTGTVQGTNASETLVGREGLDDTLLGMDGNDILQGKSGDDVLTGGLGEDTFIWTKNDIDGVSTPDLDIITDFEAGDKLNLSDLLQGETIGDAANLADYLNWDAVTEVLSVSADGNFSGGYSAAQSDLNIQIDNYAGDFNNLVDNHII